MFWNKNEHEQKICEVDKNLNECSSVAKIRQWQDKIIDIHNKNKKIEKVLRGNQSFPLYDFYSIGDTSFLAFANNNHRILQELNEDGYGSFKEFFSAFLDYIDKVNKLDELTDKINAEKQKLGIN